MSDRNRIIALVCVKNEEKNIRKCLKSLEKADEIVVVDSHSTDATAKIACDEFGAVVMQFDYAWQYPKKRQWALNTYDFSNAWVLLVDADEEIPDLLWEEMRAAINKDDNVNAYMVQKGFHFLGKRMKFGGFSHKAILFFKYGCARFERLFNEEIGQLDMEVHERIIVDGKVGALSTPLIHDDYKDLESYLDRHNKYSTWDAALRFNYINNREFGVNAIRPKFTGNSQERRRAIKLILMRVPFESYLWFIYHYFIRLGFLEGRRGLIACQIRAGYIDQIRSKMYELSLNEMHSKDSRRV